MNNELDAFENNAYFKNDSVLFIKLYTLTRKNPHGFFRILKHIEYADVRAWIDSQVPLLSNNKKYTYSTKCNWILNDIHKFCTCEACGKVFDDNIALNKAYPRFCGPCNRTANHELKAKSYQTRNRHKQEDPQYQANINAKVRRTKLLRYGTETYVNVDGARITRESNNNGQWHANDFAQKVKATKKRNHDDENFVNRELYRETCLKRYGCECTFQIESVKAKTKAALLMRYGVENAFQSKEIQEKCRQQHQKNYGVDNPFQSEEIKARIRQTMIAKYGVANPMQSPRIRSKAASDYQYDDRMFDSKEELMFYIWLQDNKIAFEYQPNVTLQYEYKEALHTYHPDFLVQGQLVEIKGDHFFKADGTMCNPYDHTLDALYEAKHQCMLKNGVKIIKTSECTFFKEHFKQKFNSMRHLNNFKTL